MKEFFEAMLELNDMLVELSVETANEHPEDWMYLFFF